LTSIPKARRDTEEFPIFKRKLIGLVVLEFFFITIATVFFISFSLPGDRVLDFGKIHLSFIAISPVYISFSLLEMLQSFIHGPKPRSSSIVDEPSSVQMEDGFEGSPSQLCDIEMHESDFADSDPGESSARGKWPTGVK
jgi:hypothetical protein